MLVIVILIIIIIASTGCSPRTFRLVVNYIITTTTNNNNINIATVTIYSTGAARARAAPREVALHAFYLC